jgi:hypothetical protein
VSSSTIIIRFVFSVVLINEQSTRAHIVLRADIVQLKIIDRTHSVHPQMNKDPFVNSTCSIDGDTNDRTSCDARMNKLRSFLSSKRIPFDEKLDESKSIVFSIQNGLVHIAQPYRLENLTGTNEIVLSRLQQLLRSILN